MSAVIRWGRPAVVVAVLAFGAVFPLLFSNPLTTTYAIDTLIFVGWVVAWNMFSGYTGYISLGHAVFFGSGAYTVALLALHHNLKGGVTFALLPLGGLVGAAIAVPFGLVALRVRRHTFVVVTIAVFFIFQLLAYNLAFTGGNGGASTPFAAWDPATYNNPYYYAAFLIAVGAVVLSWLVRGSRFGLQLLAIRDDEDRARGLGVRAMRVKLTAFVMSAFVTGVVGGLWVLFLGQALPNTVYNPNYDLTVALMGFLGGFGTLWGPVLGALILEPTQQQITLHYTNGYTGEIVFGALFLLVILFLPRGLLPTGKEWLTKLQAWRERRGQPVPGGDMAAPGTAVAAGSGDGTGSVAAAGTAERSGTPGTGGAR
jgi:branched-chain amino acid transport system permease protein